MEHFVRERITKLRLHKNISEYQLSYALGHSRGYINNISSGKSLPSLNELFSICDYFEITPAEFFDEPNDNPILIAEIKEELRDLEDEDMRLLLTIIKRLKQTKETSVNKKKS